MNTRALCLSAKSQISLKCRHPQVVDYSEKAQKQLITTELEIPRCHFCSIKSGRQIPNSPFSFTCQIIEISFDNNNIW